MPVNDMPTYDMSGVKAKVNVGACPSELLNGLGGTYDPGSARTP